MRKQASKNYREKTVFCCDCEGCRDSESSEPVFAHRFACPTCGARLDGDPNDVEAGAVVACAECKAEWEIISDAPLILAKL